MKLPPIEDNPAMQTTLQRSLERRGVQVLTCGDGARALSLWQASLPDAVLLDLSLPGRVGLLVLGDARAVGLVSLGESQVQPEAIEVVAYLPKQRDLPHHAQ
ncbi:MAG: response regulator [Hydrogenophaga sp.]|uniref:response regulator n=1 Tax=Hydrogenophaga sp. TaxID=1904254 RepID=UPI00277221AE|nr:response regulator [Hydrogenophaga sp.]MDP2419155.1 response regulator [Hydrogenophaga sp.]MDZ4186550.1 response regulator [Hydrogenophaga sp.]